MTRDRGAPAEGTETTGAEATSGGGDARPGADTPAIREVPLGHDGRMLRIRHLGPGDEAALGELYDALSYDDRRLRFFSAYHPTPDLLTRWALVGERGGCGLVADVDGRIVAHACYEPLPDGNAELAITVSPAWRGWLGAFLLNVLVEEAALGGVPGLEAEVLSENSRMLALLRRRGYAVLERPDWGIVRLVIGTDERVPHWPGAHRRPRILVEGTSGPWSAEEAAKRAGFDVLFCPGPASEPESFCPALRGEPCPLVTEADVVVVAGGSDSTAHDLATAHVKLGAGTPVVVHGRSAPPGAIPLPRDTHPDEVVERLRELVGSGPGDVPS